MRTVAVWSLLLSAGARAQEASAPAVEPAPEARVQPKAPESMPPTRPTVEPPLTMPPAPPPAALPPVPGLPPATPVPAQVPPAHQHLGLFAHLDTGVAYLRTSGSRSGSTFAGEGVALGAGVAFGWAPNEEWALARRAVELEGALGQRIGAGHLGRAAGARAERHALHRAGKRVRHGRRLGNAAGDHRLRGLRRVRQLRHRVRHEGAAGQGVAVELLPRPRHRCRALLLGEPGRRERP